MGPRGNRASGRIAVSLVGLVVIACTSIIGLPDLPDIPGKGAPEAGGAAGLGAAGAGGSTSGKGGIAGTKAGGALNGGSVGGASGAEGGTAGQSSMGGSTSGGTGGDIGSAGEGVANAGGADANGGTGGSGGKSGGGGNGGSGAVGGSAGGPVMECDAAAGTPDGCTSGPILRFASFELPASKLYSAPSFELVFDAKTGLTWQRSVAKRDDGTCMGPVKLTLSEAICYCNNLSLPDEPGGWRLPSRVELMSILDFSETPTVDSSAFLDTPSGVFWTSSLLGGDISSGAFHIAFNSGGVSRNGDPNDTNFVRCVKGGWTGTAPHYTAGTGSLANTVYDNWTDLRWLAAPTGPGTSDELAASCGAVTIGGRVWRVPTVLELLSLVDETASGLSFDTSFFQDSAPDGHDFGSSTPFDGWVECVNFDGGQSELMQPNDQKWTRCVADD